MLLVVIWYKILDIEFRLFGYSRNNIVLKIWF